MNQNNSNDTFTIAGREFSSRLLVGTGKYTDFTLAKKAVEASGAQIITMSLRRVNLSDINVKKITDYLSPEEYTYLPNSAGCYSADEAVRTLRLARAAGGWNMVKLEVMGDKVTLYPDMVETLKAAETLVNDDFDVMVYCNDDPIMAKQLEEIGCCAIMPLAAPIGSGLGIQNHLNIEMIVHNARVPVLVDAGVGTASDAAIAMELGCDGILMNTAISDAKDPVKTAGAMKMAVQAGRDAHLAGRIPKKQFACASSPQEGVIGSSGM